MKKGVLRPRFSLLTALLFLLAGVAGFAGDGPVVHNKLGLEIAAIYGLPVEDAPTQLAGPLGSDGSAIVDRKQLEAFEGIAIVFTRAGASGTFQFLCAGFPDDAKQLTLEKNVIYIDESETTEYPALVMEEDGQIYSYPAGVLFESFAQEMLEGMDRARFHLLTNPLNQPSPDLKCAINLAETSWDIVKDGIMFEAESGDRWLLKRVSLSCDANSETLMALMRDYLLQGATPHFIDLDGKSPRAFDAMGMRFDRSAVMHEGLENADGDAKWEAMLDFITGSSLEAINPAKDAVGKMVFSTQGLVHEVQLRYAGNEIHLMLYRQKAPSP